MTGLFCDAAGPASSLLHEAAEAELQVQTLSGREQANACGLFVDLVCESRLRGAPRRLCAPFLIAGASKSVYDLGLYVLFRNVEVAGERR